MNTNWKTLRVFISSTFHDMQAERDHLVRFVFPRLREELLTHRIHFVDIDLRWGVTCEQDTIELCREIIDECQPRFLCILGGRYGWQPPGKERSITADEIYYGVLDRELGNKEHSYFYFRDDSVTASMEEDCPGQYREVTGSKPELLLQELKDAIVSTGYEPFQYSAKWDGNSKRLIRLETFGNQVYHDLMVSIEHEIGNQAIKELDEFAEENCAVDSFMAKHIHQFVLGSRTDIYEKLLEHVNSSSKNGCLCLIGESGSGKSALLSYLSHHLALSGDSSTLVVSHFVGASIHSTDVYHALRRLCHELISGTTISADMPDKTDELLRVFPNIIEKASKEKRIILIIDAVNQFSPSTYLSGLWWFPQPLPENVRLVFSILPCSLLESIRLRSKPPVELVLDNLSPSDQEAIINTFLYRHRKSITKEQLATLLAKSDSSNPLYILTALEELRTLGIFEEISSHIEQLPQETQALFTWILKRLEQDDGLRNVNGQRIGHLLVPYVISMLSISRYGLSEHELNEIVKQAEYGLEPEFTDYVGGNVASLLRLLRPYLMQRGELIDFCHNQFREASKSCYLSTKKIEKSLRTKLGDYFQDQEDWLEGSTYSNQPDVKPPIPDSNANLRKVTELPWQRYHAQQWDELEQLITSLGFVNVKIRANMLEDLIEDSMKPGLSSR